MSKGFGMVPAWFAGQLSTNEIAVWVALTWHADKEGSCWPSHTALGEAVGLSESSVKRALTSLRDRGLVSWERQQREHGGDTSNLYRIYMSGGSEGPTPQVTGTDPVGHSDRRTRTNEPEPTNQTINPSSSPAVTDDPSESEFWEAFWMMYPRKVGKRAARAAFDRALKRADGQVIVGGAVSYANDPNREDAFTAHPTTWLNRDGWEDEPLPPRNGVSAPSKTLETMELAARMRAEEQALELEYQPKEITR